MDPPETPEASAETPAPAPPSPRPLTRGLGIAAGVASFGAMGLADGILALVRAPRGSLTALLGAQLLTQCVMVLAGFGFALGLFEELALASLRRVGFMQRFGAWALGGPRRWFARDPDAAVALLLVGVGVGLAVGPTFPIAYNVILSFHSKGLAALAILLAEIVTLVVGAGVALVLAAPLRWLFRRLGPLASPGLVAVVMAVALALQAVRFIALNWGAFHNLEFGAAGLAGALLVGNVLALLVLGRHVTTRARPIAGAALLATACAALLAFLVSAFSFGARQTVAATIFNHSMLTGRVARTFQKTIDLDRDGFSPLFNGGDCNDRNARIFPGAADIPGNGIDENCTGQDARVHQEEDDGHLVEVTGPLAGQKPSFVLLSIDAVRPDHLGSYGYRRPTSPNLDAFAREAARFTHAYCASPRSLRSFSSIWVGRYPSLIQWGNDNQFPPLEESNVTLAESLREAGYVSAGFINADYFNRTAGFFQGFADRFEANGFKDEVGPTVDSAARWIRDAALRPEPFFVWVHLMEPHDPYRDHREPREFGHSPVDRYDEEIARADQAAKNILDAVEFIGASRPVVTVVIGDHGEAFNEHGYEHHSFDLHEEAIRVPLLVRGPGIAPGPREALTSLMDLHPTFLNYAGRQPAGPISGRSLVPALQDPHMPIVGRGWRDHLYAEVTPDGLLPYEQKALIAPPYKILWDVRHGTWEVFDLVRDPGEIHNLYDVNPGLAADLRARLLTWVEGVGVGRTRSDDLIAAARLPGVPKMQNTVGVRFGNVVELLGYDIDSRQVPVGGVLRVMLYYRVLERTHDPMRLGLFFDPVDRIPIWGHFHAMHFPVFGRYQTTHWIPGEILRDEVALRVEREMRPVRLRMLFGVEQDGAGRRIPPAARARHDGTLDIGELEITPP